MFLFYEKNIQKIENVQFPWKKFSETIFNQFQY